MRRSAARRAAAHLRAEGGGRPLPLLRTAGQRHEAVVFEALLEQGAVKRPG